MIATFAGCNSAAFIVKLGWPIIPAILVAILIGVAIGTINGMLITHMRIEPFICTLGMQYVVNGLILVTTKSVPITGLLPVPGPGLPLRLPACPRGHYAALRPGGPHPAEVHHLRPLHHRHRRE
jgi:ribose/xylose/arabinose/galactoside ABC-type transport system permease subunit